MAIAARTHGRACRRRHHGRDEDVLHRRRQGRASSRREVASTMGARFRFAKVKRKTPPDGPSRGRPARSCCERSGPQSSGCDAMPSRSQVSLPSSRSPPRARSRAAGTCGGQNDLLAVRSAAGARAPVDCITVHQSPPDFTWPPQGNPGDKSTYTLTLTSSPTAHREQRVTSRNWLAWDARAARRARYAWTVDSMPEQGARAAAPLHHRARRRELRAA